MESMDAFFHYANATRYLSGAGLVALIYDHLLTLPSEISLIWPAASSYAKHLFLFNRYLVPASLLVISYEMNYFWARPLTQEVSVLDSSSWRCRTHSRLLRIRISDPQQVCRCRNMFSVIAMLSVISLGMANILVLLRVVCLWDRSRSVAWLLTVGFIVSFGATSSMMLASLVELADSVAYSPLFSMCILSKTTPKLIIVWGAPMIFEVAVLVATWWNALSIPRRTNTPLRAALHKDGVTFFMALSLFRCANLSLAATRRPELVMMTVFFVWSMTTLILNRSLLRLQRAENLQLVLNGMIEEELAHPPRSLPNGRSVDSDYIDDFLAGMRPRPPCDEEILPYSRRY